MQFSLGYFLFYIVREEILKKRHMKPKIHSYESETSLFFPLGFQLPVFSQICAEELQAIIICRCFFHFWDYLCECSTVVLIALGTSESENFLWANLSLEASKWRHGQRQQHLKISRHPVSILYIVVTLFNPFRFSDVVCEETCYWDMSAFQTWSRIFSRITSELLLTVSQWHS